MDVNAMLAASKDFVTPLPVVDEDALEANLTRMAATASSAGVRLRPHAKTHKCLFIADRQLKHGAVGLTVATLHEAEVFAAAGVDDILIAHPPVGEPKNRRLAELSLRVRRLAVSLDDVGIAASLPSNVEIMWEVDTGLRRVGTLPGEPTVRPVTELVRLVSERRFRGLMTFGGHVYGSTNQTERWQAAREEAAGVIESARLLSRSGISVRELSIGSTPTASFVAEFPGVSEIRPGTYVFGDVNQVALGSQTIDQCAFAVVTTVVSTPTVDRAVVDAGSKALSTDSRTHNVVGFGTVMGRPDLTLDRLSEEHGVLTASGETGLRPGERLAIVPLHVCTTTNLYPWLLIVSGVRARREEIVARGWDPASW